MARESSARSSIKDLDVDHYTAFTNALTSILSTEKAEITYAEIIDGMPTAATWKDYSSVRHDLVQKHYELCEGSLETAKEFRANFRPDSLQFDTTVRFLTATIYLV